MSSSAVPHPTYEPREDSLAERVEAVVNATPVIDMHTHLFAPEFGSLNLWGIDEVLTYHYLVAEFFRSSDMSYDHFWALSKAQQADAIWQTLFVENSPLSEAACGVCGILTAFGLDPGAKDLNDAREFFASRQVEMHIDEILVMAGVSDIVMTNDPFDAAELPYWEKELMFDTRFHAVLRLDPLLNQWDQAHQQLSATGYMVDKELSNQALSEVRRFLSEWIARMKPLYAAVSLPDDFQFPDNSLRCRLLKEAAFPACREADIPFAMMIGVRRAVNPLLRLAGDGVGRANVTCVERICEAFPDNRFLVTMLSRENQHEVCVAARKFRNLMVFGCWWFMNNPSIISELTRERLEMLGTSFIPQHSDARILDQLIYKWRHSRGVIAAALTESYSSLEKNGRIVTDEDIENDVKRLFSGNFRSWTTIAES